MYLIDTNVISEIRKGKKANPGVQRFFQGVIQSGELTYLSVITLGELRRGVDLIFHRGDLDQGKLLENWLNALLIQYQDHILGIDGEIAMLWGKLRVRDCERIQIWAHSLADRQQINCQLSRIRK